MCVSSSEHFAQREVKAMPKTGEIKKEAKKKPQKTTKEKKQAKKEKKQNRDRE